MKSTLALRGIAAAVFFSILVFGCDSVDNSSTDENTPAVLNASDDSGSAFSKQGVDLTACPPGGSAFCQVDLAEPNNGPVWTVTFLSKDYNVSHPGYTTFKYRIHMPTNGSNSGKIALSIPACCTWAEGLSDGNRNSNAATDVEFNTSQEFTDVDYVFVGNVWTNQIQAGLKVQNQTSPSARLPIYGPGVNPNHTISGYVFLDAPASPSVGPNDAFDAGEGLAGVTVTLVDTDAEYTAVTNAQGYYAFENFADGSYTVEVRSQGGNEAFFDSKQYLPVLAAFQGQDPYVLFSGGVNGDTPVTPFGLEVTYSISGRAYIDTPVGNGLPNHDYSVGEPVIAGAVIGIDTSPGTTTTASDGTFLFESLRWGTYHLTFPDNVGVNPQLLVRTAYLPTEPLASTGYDSQNPDTWQLPLTPYTVLVNADITDRDFGFMVNVKGAIKAFTDGAALTTGLPREYWKVQATGKGSPKYQPEISFTQFQTYMDEIEAYFVDGGHWSPFGDYDRVTGAIPILKTESNNDIQEALRTEILVALLNYVSDRGTVTIEGKTISTLGFIENGLNVLEASGYAGKVPSGSVAESEQLLSSVNGGA